jgi:hypothetical protein
MTKKNRIPVARKTKPVFFILPRKAKPVFFILPRLYWTRI